jgi:hypothetical protein
MKNVIVLGILLFMITCFSAKAQATNSTRTTANGSTPSASQNGLSGASGKNEAGMRTNEKTSRGKADTRPQTGLGSTSSSTVDGSTNGSATNDGASGQSGSPVANQSAAINKGEIQSTNSRGMKNSKMNKNSKPMHQ